MLKITIQNKGSLMPLLYYSQLVIFAKLVPDDQNMALLEDFLRLCSNEIHSRK